MFAGVGRDAIEVVMGARDEVRTSHQRRRRQALFETLAITAVHCKHIKAQLQMVARQRDGCRRPLTP